MTDDRPKRIDLTDTTKEHGRTLVHLLGYHGDDGENESVLSVSTDLSPGENFPESGRIFVGTPQKSPLLEGYFPDLGGFTRSPDAADRLAEELTAASAAARAAMVAGKDHAIDISPGSLRVWWVVRATGKREERTVFYIDDATCLLRCAELELIEGGMEVFKDGEWTEWHNAYGDDIHSIMAGI